jgi:archaeal flagellin FlaB
MKKLNKIFTSLLRSQKGITGLETAIILIAFVTVASVLAYSVLSAGIFSSEKGKAAVYQGLDQASASMELRGSVLAFGTVDADPTKSTVDTIQFTLASVLQDAPVDMTVPPANSVVINYTDSDGMNVQDVQNWTATLVGTERGTVDMLDADEAMIITVTLPANTLLPYSTFTLQVIPPKGAAITVSKTIPGVVDAVMDLH